MAQLGLSEMSLKCKLPNAGLNEGAINIIGLYFFAFRGSSPDLLLRLLDGGHAEQELHALLLHRLLRHPHDLHLLLLLTDRHGRGFSREGSQGAGQEDECGELAIK